MIEPRPWKRGAFRLGLQLLDESDAEPNKYHSFQYGTYLVSARMDGEVYTVRIASPDKTQDIGQYTKEVGLLASMLGVMGGSVETDSRAKGFARVWRIPRKAPKPPLRPLGARQGLRDDDPVDSDPEPPKAA